MIYAELQKDGAITVSGPIDVVLTEYTILTRMVMRQLKNEFGEEEAYKIVAGLGQLAARNIDELANDLKEMQDNIGDILDEGDKR